MSDSIKYVFTPRIKCCYGCEAPKRYLGCHDHCEEYKAEKDVAERKKSFLRNSVPSSIRSGDFEQINSTLNRKYRKRRRRK